MNYAVEMGSGGMKYIPNFVKISSSIQKLFGGYTCRYTGPQTAR
jgi:hypothetical protein